VTKAIILGTDLNYIQHIKYNINNIKEKFNETDIVIITYINHLDKVKEELEKYNVIIYPINFEDNPFYIKYHVFDKYFKRWDKILYLDCDTIILDNLNKLFDLLDDENEMFVDFEQWPIIRYFDSYCPQTIDNENEYKSLLNEKYISFNGFNAGILLYKSSIISDDLIDKIHEYHIKYNKINKHVGKGSDQPILNLILMDRCKQVPNNYFSFWKRYDQNSLILHFCHWEAPWHNDAFNDKINQRYIDYYDNNKN